MARARQSTREIKRRTSGATIPDSVFPGVFPGFPCIPALFFSPRDEKHRTRPESSSVVCSRQGNFRRVAAGAAYDVGPSLPTPFGDTNIGVCRGRIFPHSSRLRSVLQYVSINVCARQNVDKASESIQPTPRSPTTLALELLGLDQVCLGKACFNTRFHSWPCSLRPAKGWISVQSCCCMYYVLYVEIGSRRVLLESCSVWHSNSSSSSINPPWRFVAEAQVEAASAEREREEREP